MTALKVYAGPRALRRIREEGLHADQYAAMAGASGGPKWFILFELDKYLFGDFFQSRREPLMTIGSSAGAWRLACLATANPVDTITTLAQAYAGEHYSPKPTVDEITLKVEGMLHKTLGESGCRQIAINEKIKVHIVTARCKGLGSSRHKYLQGAALSTSAVLNAVSRKSLSNFYQRTIFTNLDGESPFAGLDDLDTRFVKLTESNVFEALLATGSIPFVLRGVRDISGAAPGLYLDGGITDYHFDLDFSRFDGLVLYPHFSPLLIPGWFDKKLRWRRVPESHLDNVVLVTPSKEFVATLPRGKISERSDFLHMSEEARLEYWCTMLEKGAPLAAEFQEMVETGSGIERVLPIAKRER